MNFSIEIRKKTFFFILLMLPFFYNVFTDIYPIVYRVNTICKIFSSIIIIIHFLNNAFRNKKMFDKMFFITFMGMIALFISTVFSKGSIFKYVGYFISCFVILMAFSTFSNNKSKSAFTQAIYIIIKLYIILEVLLLIIYPSGMFSTVGINRLTFLGLDNNAVPFLIMSFSYIIYYVYSKKDSISMQYIIDLALITFCIFFMFSATGIIGLSIVVFSLLMKKQNANKKILLALLTNIVIFLIFFSAQNLGPIQYIVVNVFHKSVSLSGRVPIWNAYILDIKQNIFIGHGIMNMNQALVYVQETWDYRLAHNEMLQHIADGGIFYLFLFLIMILLVGSKLKNIKDKSTNALISGVCAFLVMFVTETYSQNTCFYILLFSSYYFINNNKFSKER